FCRRDRPQARHGELAPHDDAYGPRGRESVFDEGDERGTDEQLVGNGVEQYAEARDLSPPARDMSVEVVREGRAEEERDAEHVALDAEPVVRKRREQHDDEHWD